MLSRWMYPFAVAVVVGVACQAGEASIVIVSQERNVIAGAGVQGEESQEVNLSAPDAGRFNETASAEVTGAGAYSRASASMDSTLGQERFTFSGIMSYEAQNTQAEGSDAGFAVTEANMRVRFRVDRPYEVLVLRDTEVLTRQDEIAFFDSASEFSRVDAGEILGEPYRLEAGVEYEFGFAVRLNTTIVNEDAKAFSASYEAALDFTPVGGGNGGGPNPIPLPPGVWAGGAMLGAIAFGRIRGMLRRA